MECDLVLDTSALLAILLKESGSEEAEVELMAAKHPCILTASILEATMVLTRYFGHSASRELATILERFGKVTTVPFDEECNRLAIEAFLHYGKGRNPASLNLGDCMVYGLAAKHNAPVLCTGNHFRQTDLRVLP